MPQTISSSAYKAALFDFDETMIDLEPQHIAASAALCELMGSDYDRLPDDIRFASGRRILDEIAEMRDFFGWNRSIDELLDIRQQRFREACEQSELRFLPCVVDVVRALHARGLRLAITTSAVAAEIDAILRRLQLRDEFETIVDGSEVERAKPDPEAYLVTARKLGVDPRDCIVFEDSRIGVLAAKGAGMTCIAVRSQQAHTPQDLSAADAIVATFCEVSVE